MDRWIHAVGSISQQISTGKYVHGLFYFAQTGLQMRVSAYKNNAYPLLRIFFSQVENMLRAAGAYTFFQTPT